MRVRKPRLRRKEGGEVEVPAYGRLRQQQGLAGQMLKMLLGGLSTRRYREVLPRMAEAVGVSRSSVSREAREASASNCGNWPSGVSMTWICWSSLSTGCGWGAITCSRP
jgi:Transposase, Mutator family